jgi:hypothetical protein
MKGLQELKRHNKITYINKNNSKHHIHPGFLHTIEIYLFKSNVFTGKDIEFTAVENQPNPVKEI